MPNYSFLPNWMLHICILQVYSGNTYNSSKALVLYSAAEAKKLQRHPPATYFIVWDFTEPGADTITDYRYTLRLFTVAYIFTDGHQNNHSQRVVICRDTGKR